MKQDAEDALRTIKVLLQKTWPHLLTKRVKAEDYHVVPSGCVHMIAVSPTEGLVWNDINHRVVEEVNFLKAEEIVALQTCSLFKVNTCTLIC